MQPTLRSVRVRRDARGLSAATLTCCSLVGLRAGANDHTWASPNTDFWRDSLAWSPLGQPGTNDSAIIDQTGAAYTVTVDQFTTAKSVTLNSSSATLRVTNQTMTVLNGAFSIGGGTLAVNSGAFFVLDHSDFFWQNGKIQGTVELRDNCVARLDATDGAGATILCSRNGCSIDSDIPSGANLVVSGNGTAHNVALGFNNGGPPAHNNGTITLVSQNSSYNSGLDLTADLINNGTIQLNQGSGGPRSVVGNIVNNFAFYDRAPGATNFTGRFDNNNLASISPGVNFIVDGTFNQNIQTLEVLGSSTLSIQNRGTFNYNGGTVSGGVHLSGGSNLTTTVGDAHGAAFIFENDDPFVNDNGFVRGNVATNGNVTVNPGIGRRVDLFVDAGSSNFGTISLNSSDSAFGSAISTLSVWDSTTGIVGADDSLKYKNFGAIRTDGFVNRPAGGDRAIFGSIDNYGQIDIHATTNMFGYISMIGSSYLQVDESKTLTIHGLFGGLVQEGGTVDVEKNALIDLVGGASYIFKSGTLVLKGASQTHTPTVVGRNSSVVAQGIGAVFTCTSLISQDGGNILSTNGSNIVSQGGGNIVAQGGGNIVAQGGGNIVAQGGGNAPALGPPLGDGPIPPDSGNIIADAGTIVLSQSFASADGWCEVHNAGLLTGNGTFTAANFDVDATSTVNATGGALYLAGPINSLGHIAINPGAALVLQSTDASIPDGGGSITLNGAMIFDYSGASSPLGAVRAALLAGRADGAWNGSGINSTAAAANPQFAIGYAEASASGISTFSGQSVDATALLLRVTYSGDANLDGSVNALDFSAVATNFGGSGMNWSDGDFNYDGSVDTSDFTMLASNFGQTLTFPAPPLGDLVPEPANLLILSALAGMGFGGRSRRERVRG